MLFKLFVRLFIVVELELLVWLLPIEFFSLDVGVLIGVLFWNDKYGWSVKVSCTEMIKSYSFGIGFGHT